MPEPSFYPLQLEPGWYAYDWANSTEMTAKLRAMQVKYQGRWHIQRTWDSAKAKHSVMVFQVKQTIWWEMPGAPIVAPKGSATQLKDLPKIFPEPSTGFIAMIEDITGSAYDFFRDFGKAAKDVGDQTKTAVTVLIWGGAAVLLLNLFRYTSEKD
jgi:hypothetical protein